jgi:hypothetical protein
MLRAVFCLDPLIGRCSFVIGRFETSTRKTPLTELVRGLRPNWLHGWLYPIENSASTRSKIDLSEREGGRRLAAGAGAGRDH